MTDEQINELANGIATHVLNGIMPIIRMIDRERRETEAMRRRLSRADLFYYLRGGGASENGSDQFL